MDPAQLIPAAEAIPSPWLLFEGLLILTFVLHVVFMNLAVGSAALILASRLTGRMPDLAEVLGRRATTFLALTVNLGVAPLLFVQVLYGQFLYTSSVLMAGWWLSAILAVILGYYGLYVHAAKRASSPGFSRLVLALALGLLLYMGFLLSNNMTLMLRPQAWTAYFENPRGSLLNLADPTLWPRYLHMILAAPAVAGLYAALLGQAKGRPDWVDHGLAWFSRLTMLQVLVGGWLLFALPRQVMLSFMGQNALATGLLAAGAALGLASIFTAVQKNVRLTVGLVLCTIALMAATRGQVRLATLAPYFHPSSLPVTPDATPLLMFVVSLAAGLAVIGYMIRTYMKSARDTAGRG